MTAEEAIVHRCFAGYLGCSGCNPCEACARMVEQHVLPHGVVAAGQGGVLLQLVHVFAEAIANLGYDPEAIALQEVGVPLSSVFPTVEDQVVAFRDGFREGFMRLVDGINGADPPLASLAKVTTIPLAPPEVPAGTAPPHAPGEPARVPLVATQSQQPDQPTRRPADQPAPAPVALVSPEAAAVGEDVQASFERFAKEQLERRKAAQAPQPSAVSPPRELEQSQAVPAPSPAPTAESEQPTAADEVRAVQRILTAADVAAAGELLPDASPEAAPMPVNGVVEPVSHLETGDRGP